MPRIPVVPDLASVYTTEMEDGPVSLRDFEQWLKKISTATNKPGLAQWANQYAGFIITNADWGMTHDIATMTVDDMMKSGVSYGHAQLIFANLQGGQEQLQSVPSTPHSGAASAASGARKVA